MIRRSVLLTSGLATLMSLLLWALSYSAFRDDGSIGCFFAHALEPAPLAPFAEQQQRARNGWCCSIITTDSQSINLYGDRGRFVVWTESWQQNPVPDRIALASSFGYLQRTGTNCFGPVERGLPVDRALQVRVWLLATVFGVWHVVAAVRAPSRRRTLRCRRGLCTQCGYDLTGNMSGVCPECGQAI